MPGPTQEPAKSARAQLGGQVGANFWKKGKAIVLNDSL